MHELKLVKELAEKALNIAKENQAKKVNKICNCSPFRKTKPKISCRSSSKLIRGGLDRGGG